MFRKSILAIILT